MAWLALLLHGQPGDGKGTGPPAVASATGTTYAIAAAQASDEGAYRCVVSNSAGIATSDAAFLSAFDAPTIASLSVSTSAVVSISWLSELGTSYTIQSSTNLVTDAFTTIVTNGIAATPPTNTCDVSRNGDTAFYRVVVE